MAEERMATVKKLIDGAQKRVDLRRTGVDRSHPAGREYSLAITALEEARMRFARGVSMEMGTHEEHDMELIERGVESTMDGMREQAQRNASEDPPPGVGG